MFPPGSQGHTFVSRALLPQIVTLGPSPAVISHHHPCCQWRTPSYAPHMCPALHAHTQPLFCLGTDSALLHILQSHSQIHGRVWEQKNERVLLPFCLPDIPMQAMS